MHIKKEDGVEYLISINKGSFNANYMILLRFLVLVLLKYVKHIKNNIANF